MFTPQIKAFFICGVKVKPLWWNRFSNIHFQCIFQHLLKSLVLATVTQVVLDQVKISYLDLLIL